MALIHILDKQTDAIIGTLNSDKGEATEATRIDSLSNQNTFDFSALKKFDILQKRNRLLLQDTDVFFIEFIINYAEQYKRNQKIVRSDASFIDLAKAKVIEPQTLQGTTASTATDTALIGTEWQPGDIDYNGIITITIEEYTNPLALLKRIASGFDLEIQYRVEVDGNNIVGRYVDMKKKIVEFEGKEIEFGKDLIGISRKEDSSLIVTALLGVGPEKEDGTRLTVLVEDQEALQRWGRNGQHLIEMYEPESTNQEMTESELRKYTENELKKRVDAIVSYECTAASIEHIFGHSHEKIRKGQTVRIKDDGYSPPLYVEARIEEVETDPISKRVLTFKIGNFIEYRKEDLEKQISSLKNLMSDRLAKLVMASISSNAGEVFKNGLGSTVLTAKTFLGGVEIDNDGTKYSYKWSKRDKDGNLVTFSKTGKSITVSSSEVTEKATFIIEIAINDKTSQVAQITLSKVFDGATGPQGPTGADGKTPYLHIAYATNSTGSSGFSTTDSVGKTYIGTYTDFVSADSTDYTKYSWSLIKGDKGDTGPQGPKGDTGSAGRDGIVNAIRRIRYIRDWINGSSANTGNHWVEIRAIAGNVNRAKGKVPTASSNTTNLSYVTDENISSSFYAGGATGLQYVQIDLGSIYDDIDYIQTWHYYADGRTYNNTKVEVSEDGINWIALFDSTITGKYKETSRGLTVLINPKIISAITALQLNVDKLSAITTDIGEIFAGIINGVTINGSTFNGGSFNANTKNGTNDWVNMKLNELFLEFVAYKYSDTTVKYRTTYNENGIRVENGSGNYQPYIIDGGFQTDIIGTKVNIKGDVAIQNQAKIGANLVNGWVNFLGGYQPAAYWKDANGLVHLEGMVKNGTGTIFTLPAGYRPENREPFGVVSNNNSGRIDVLATGEVQFSAGSNAWISLSTIKFKAIN